MNKKVKTNLLKQSRFKKRALLIALDVLILSLVLWGAISLHHKTFFIPQNTEWLLFPLAMISALPVFIRLGLYRAILKYFRSQAVTAILIASLVASTILIITAKLFNLNLFTPETGLLYFFGLFTCISGLRLVVQRWLYGKFGRESSGKKILIYGAGSSGTELATILNNDKSYSIEGFIDNDPSLKGWNILGVRVFSPKQINRITTQKNIQEIILAVPSADRSERQTILQSLEALPVVVRSIPSFADLASGKLAVSDIKDIDIDDLLGRKPVAPDKKLLPANITDKTVLVTGAGGSIGSELCRQILHIWPKELILLESSEFALYDIEQELSEITKTFNKPIPIIRVLGSITDQKLLHHIFSKHTIDTVYHAAAYKHVPLVEENPVAGLLNNTFGTKTLAEEALRHHVERFILISTDKAVRPTNIMGSTKRAAEMVLQTLSADNTHNTTFTMVRFGNVLGSSGSVVPKFRQQIKVGGPVTVTHKEITRYFMSIPEAVQLVIQAGAMAKGGEVFVLDMGDPVKIYDLAEKMIHLSGLTLKDESNTNGDIEIQFSGLRPGEKLYEELLIGDDVSGTNHPRIMQVQEAFLPIQELEETLEQLKIAMKARDENAIKEVLVTFIDGYKPWKDNTIEASDENENKNNIISLNINH